MRIRSPSPLDREALVEIIAQGGPFRPEEVSCAIELLEAALARAEGNTYESLVVTNDADDRPCGYVCFGATPMTEAAFDVYWIVVAAEVRGQGVGRALLDATESHLRGRGARLVRVETSSLEGQGGAARFYDRAGYRRSGTIEDFYRPGDDLITFTKKLA
jgi:ribosomal protein S18 acetylase RimI-like enzyme